MRLATRTKELTLLGFGLVTRLLQRLELSCDGLLSGLELSLLPLQPLSELRFACTDFSLSCAYVSPSCAYVSPSCAYVILLAAQTCDLAIESLNHRFCFLHVHLG